MSDDDGSATYAAYAELDLDKAEVLRDDAEALHDEAERLEDRADAVQKLGGAAEATTLRAESETVEAKADDLDRRAWLLEDAATLWGEAGAHEQRASDVRNRADAAFETALELKQRISGPLTDDEITELKVEAGRASGEYDALKERSEDLAHEAGFDIKLAKDEEAAAGFVRRELPPGPESEPNPDLMPPE
jgi:hypothetical protein